jgi:hypothetical protein
MRLIGLDQKVCSRSGDVTVLLREQWAAGVQDEPKSLINRQRRGTWNPPYFRSGLLEQVKPQGTLLEVRE